MIAPKRSLPGPVKPSSNFRGFLQPPAGGADVQLSVQHMLNCGRVGSCHGGTVDGPYQWIHRLSDLGVAKMSGDAGILVFTFAFPYFCLSLQARCQMWRTSEVRLAQESATSPLSHTWHVPARARRAFAPMSTPAAKLKISQGADLAILVATRRNHARSLRERHV